MGGESLDTSLAFLAGGGELGERIRSFDWTTTSLGSPSAWSQSLKTAVRIILTSRQPFWLGWGPELVYLYNDPYKAIIGGKHPDALGKPVREVWGEIWDTIAPMLSTAMYGDTGTYVESQLLIMERHGYREETYYTFSYSPIPDDQARAGGIICANTDDTQRVIGERQLALLRALAAGMADARTWQEACVAGAAALGTNARDIPFALVYVCDPDGSHASLMATAGIGRDHPAAREVVALEPASPWPIGEAIASAEIVVVEDLPRRFATLPAGAWPAAEPPTRAAVVPLRAAGREGRSGALVLALNPFRRLDDGYQRFLSLVAGQFEASIASADAYEQERKRAESLAELDRAKTTFFSNVSHEFRTPLTLMMGPIEDLLERGPTELSPAAKQQLEVVHRNSARLLELVNTMLDFSRIEAGRMQALFEPTAVAELTAELASIFRSAVERAGLQLVVECEPPSDPVYVDRDMWEKIVINLLSNAFKFTLEGEIRVTLRPADGCVRLAVRDTGVGIPKDELGKVFDRFHRVASSRGRTHEGTGIGLSVVQELVRMHHGSVRVSSELGRGTELVVEIPVGKAHLDPRLIHEGASVRPGSRGRPAQAFVGSVLHWLPEGAEDEGADAWARRELASIPAGPPTPVPAADRPRVLVADDNRDMREYVSRLLAEDFEVQAVGDGQAALELLRERSFELVLTDVMMPRLDGFGLLAEIRADERLRETPVVMVSARAGEEARVEGVEAGADDYLTKPFTTKELVARVSAHVRMARARREASRRILEEQQRLHLALETGKLGVLELDLATDQIECSLQCRADLGLPDAATLDHAGLLALLHPEDRERVRQAMQAAIAAAGEYEAEYRVVRPVDRSVRWILARGRALVGPEGRPTHLINVTLDITERKLAQQALEASERRFRTMADTAPAMLWITEPDGSCSFLSLGWYEYTGQTEAEALGFGWTAAVHPDDRARSTEIFLAANASRTPFVLDYRLRRSDGSHRWAIDAGRPRLSESGELLGFIGSVIDVHDRKQAEEALKESDRRKDEFLATLAHELRNPLAPLRVGLELLGMAGDDRALFERTRAVMQRQVTHMVRLIDDLLDINRISRGRLKLRTSIVSVLEVVERAVESARPGCEGSAQVLALWGPDAPLYVLADPDRLQQVVTNLVNNACKFTPRGGRIDVFVAREGGDATVRVRDTGVGIAADQLEPIFEMFTQVRAPDGIDGRTGSGLGIGLTLTKRLVELHGGRIGVVSEGVGHGSEFTVRLPLAVRVEEQATEPDGSPKHGSERPRRILVVDDNRDAADMLTVLLEHAGHHTITAYDGAQALAMAEGFRPDIVLLDLGLPGIDGYEVCRRLREHPWARSTTIAAVTGWGQQSDRRRSAEAGFDHHLVKPIDREALAHVLGA